MSNLLGGLLSATINPLTGLTTSTVEYLVVAGGGGGGGQSNSDQFGGGGGAGGLLTATGYAITAGSAITVTVGAGGAGGSNAAGSAGVSSVFGSITATSGGYGGRNSVGGNGQRFQDGDQGSGKSCSQDQMDKLDNQIRHTKCVG